MEIGIDFTSAAHQGAGIGRLTRSVVRALAEIDHDNQYALLIQGHKPRHPSLGARPAPGCRNAVSGITNDNFREVRTWITERWWNRIWHRLQLPVAVEWIVGRIDLFHSPDFTLPPVRPGTRTIVTVHDLSFLRLPQCFEPVLCSYLAANVPRAVHRADHVLADSENTRWDVIELLRVPEEKVSVLYPGVAPRFRPIRDRTELERVRAKYDLPPQFVLSVGTIQPRKNYVGLMEAFARLNSADVHLVIVGGKGWLYEDVFARARDLRIQDRVTFAGFVDDADLPALYNLARAFALPSLYEGFGIPPLEAMACGTPVVTADNSSLPEVIGDAGLLVAAEDTAALSSALEQLLGEPALRRTLIERGLAQARQFTWQRAARTLLATYQRTVEA